MLKFGLTETKGELPLSDNYLYTEVLYSVIPTVLLPLAMIGVGINVVATFVAGLFGIKLKSEGPKKILELLLKPKVIISAILLNLVIYGGYQGYLYFENMSSFIFTIENKNPGNQSAKTLSGYTNHLGHINRFEPSVEVSLPVKGIKTLWQTELKKGPFRAAAVSGDRLFFGTFDKNAYEIDSGSGEVVRNFNIGTKVTPSPIIWNNYLVMGEGTHHTHHARIYFFDIKTGKYVKSYQTKGHTEAQPIIATHNNQTLMFVVSGSDGIHAVDPTTLNRIWRNNDGHMDASVIVEGKSVYGSTGKEKGDAKKYKTYALSYDFSSGKTNWKREIPASGWMKPVLYKNNVCFIYGEIYFPSEIGGFQCFTKKDGLPEIGYRFLNPVMARPIVIGNSAFITDLKGHICKVAMDTHKKYWCFNSKSKGKSYTTVSYDQKRNLLLYPSVNNGLFVIDPDTGKKIYHWLPDEKEKKWSATYAAITVANDAWYVAHYSGLIRKITPL